MSYLKKVSRKLGSSSDEERVKVLIVEDEELVAEMFKSWLSDAGCSVEVANGGREALRKIDRHVDVVLLDRRMPLITGDELLDIIRSEDIQNVDPEKFKLRDTRPTEREFEQKEVEDIELETAKKLNDRIVRNLQKEDIDCQICMVSAVEPDVEIVDMDFDHYVVKDVSENRLVRIVDGLSSVSGLDEQTREYQSLRWKSFLLEQRHTDAELEESEKYQQLRDRIEEIEDGDRRQIRIIKGIDFN